ncbi:hypothetical protein M758_10G124100 [Ceratodon purpureus]|nr:hypothetical protein M758_10G124100 [Ceratodon purpureus]
MAAATATLACSSSGIAVANSRVTRMQLQESSGVSVVKTPFVSKTPGLKSTSRRGLVAVHSAGLGATLPEGYEVKDRVVVDESHAGDAASGNVIDKLKAGFKNFKESNFTQNPELFEPLKSGQAPEVMIIACADSRVCPTMLHGLKPGEAFIVRSVANLVPAYDPSMENVHHGTSAAVQYAVTALGVKKVIVMGHSSCGGIKALMTMDDFGRYNSYSIRYLRIFFYQRTMALFICEFTSVQAFLSRPSELSQYVNCYLMLS